MTVHHDTCPWRPRPPRVMTVAGKPALRQQLTNMFGTFCPRSEASLRLRGRWCCTWTRHTEIDEGLQHGNRHAGCLCQIWAMLNPISWLGEIAPDVPLLSWLNPQFSQGFCRLNRHLPTFSLVESPLFGHVSSSPELRGAPGLITLPGSGAASTLKTVISCGVDFRMFRVSWLSIFMLI